MADLSTNNPTPHPLTGAELVSVLPMDRGLYRIHVHRLKVPGGWLLITNCFEALAPGVGAGLATTFVADPSGTWDTGLSDEMPNGCH